MLCGESLKGRKAVKSGGELGGETTGSSGAGERNIAPAGKLSQTG